MLGETTCLLSTDKMTSLHLVVPFKYQLTKSLALSPDDAKSIISLKNRLRLKSDDYFPIHKLHNISCLLDPCTKNNQLFIAAGDRVPAIDELKQIVVTYATITGT